MVQVLCESRCPMMGEGLVGRLSNPSQRRRSPCDINGRIAAYQGGAAIDDLAARYRITAAAHLNTLGRRHPSSGSRAGRIRAVPCRGRRPGRGRCADRRQPLPASRGLGPTSPYWTSPSCTADSRPGGRAPSRLLSSLVGGRPTCEFVGHRPCPPLAASIAGDPGDLVTELRGRATPGAPESRRERVRRRVAHL